MRKRIQKVINLSPKHLSVRDVLANTDGDQITGWLIVVLLVVVVGAFFLTTYQGTITEVWSAIVDKIYETFGI